MLLRKLLLIFFISIFAIPYILVHVVGVLTKLLPENLIVKYSGLMIFILNSSVYLMLTSFFILFGIVSLYAGIRGLMDGELELFWKKYYAGSKFLRGQLLKQGFKAKNDDLVRGFYARIWSIIYIFIGIVMVFIGLLPIILKSV